MEIVIDFSSNIISANIENQGVSDYFLSSITPNNCLALFDFLKEHGYKVLPDLVVEQDYSVAEY